MGSRWVVHEGDCRELARAGKEHAFDAIVCDPPYHLTSIVKRFGKNGSAPAKYGSDGRFSRLSGGFMGQKWDGGDVAFDPETWAILLRVLKPGGHLIVFGGTRTYHRMVCAIEDAGWEIRDSLMWLYGCLTDDTEILTVNGWKRGVDVAEGELVAVWDSATGRVFLRPVLEQFCAPYTGKMVWFHNDNTDQLLTPNHRVYKRHAIRQQQAGVRTRSYPLAWEVAEAGAINRWQPIRLPLAGYHHGAGIGGTRYAALLGWVWTDGGFDQRGSGVRITQSSVNEQHVQAIGILVKELAPAHKHYQRTRTYRGRLYVEHTWFFTGAIAKRIRDDLPEKHPTWALLWAMKFSEKLSFFDAAMNGDGSADAFYQKNINDLEWFQTLAHMIGWQGRINYKKWCVSLHDNPETELQHRHLVDASEKYEGDVWCVRVETGAFVARRNGRIFITGNSGFPKSHDVSKGIDAICGAEREVVGTRTSAFGTQTPGGVWNERFGAGGPGLWVGADPKEVPLRGGAVTDEAKRWEEWGTALKPAWESIVLARAPLSEKTVAANVLKWGTGAINIDGCRLSSNGLHEVTQGNGKHGTDGWGMGRNTYQVPSGRWPANVVLDERAAELLDAEVGNRPGMGTRLLRRGATTGTSIGGNGVYSTAAVQEVVTGYGDSGGPSRFFYTAKASKAERGEGNIHPTCKPVALMRWLVRLVTPPNGVILDPFCGSGSTGVAALQEGFRFVGIDTEPTYVEIARKRLAAAEAKLAEKVPVG